MAQKGLSNFELTIKSLEEFLVEPIVNDRDKAGIIQAFEYCYEQCWKALQQEAASQGIKVGSPKSAFSFAMENSLISITDEKKWLEMLEDRNLTSHTYKKELANQVIKRIQENYLDMYKGLYSKLSA